MIPFSQHRNQHYCHQKIGICGRLASGNSASKNDSSSIYSFCSRLGKFCIFPDSSSIYQGLQSPSSLTSLEDSTKNSGTFQMANALILTPSLECKKHMVPRAS